MIEIYDIIIYKYSHKYRSADRDKGLLLCGWRFEKDTNAPYENLFLDRLVREGAYPRAAAIAVFNLCLRQAIEILNRGARKMSIATNLNIVAMAISGFSEDRNSMWRESCLKSRCQLSDPYLRATFAFLTADNDSYENVLVSKFFFSFKFFIRSYNFYFIYLCDYRMKMVWR